MTWTGTGSALMRRDGQTLRLVFRCFALAFALAAFSNTGCTADGYELSAAGTDGDGGAGGDGGTDNGDGGNGGSDAGPEFDAGPPPDAACIPQQEVCDGEDNNCDGIDDEEHFDFENNPAHCGGCNMPCSAPPNMVGDCEASECVFECEDGWLDTDPKTPGCEYNCTPTDVDDDTCDFVDDDCDQAIDEDIDFMGDEQNCGSCGNICNPLNAVGECTDGECGYTDCDDGFYDIDEDDEPTDIQGCEYLCPENPALAGEDCDGEDDDCDGRVDEEVPTGAACSDFPEGGEGECTMGAISCVFGQEVCLGDVGPTTEVCDGEDDDCDGVIDNGFDFATDPLHCGSCDPCVLDNAVPDCVDPDDNGLGECVVFACLPGWVDENGDPDDGCEYECTPTGPEVCDGVDNDCDRLTDTEDDDLQEPANFCLTQGECSGTEPECSGGPCGGAVTWRCVYDGPVR